MSIKDILDSNDPIQLKALFSFSSQDSDEAVLTKFNLWARHTQSKYFSSKDAYFHKEIDRYNLAIYRGKLRQFIDIAFRGGAKTARTKLFRAFVICNDEDHSRRYLKILAEDVSNSVQIVTDIYNILVQPAIMALYPEIFEKTVTKREERMDSFTTATGIKLVAKPLGPSQRGALQDDARPDEIWFEDFENRTTLRSARKTISIWDSMEEARTGLAVNGGCVYTCNYISEQGNVHRLVTEKTGPGKKVLIVPILKEDGTSAWPSRYSITDIEEMKRNDDDFEGERMCKPSATKDVFFDRDKLDDMKTIEPYREIAGFKLFKQFDPSHRYGGGHDVAGGVGLDSSTSVFIDFDTVPCQVVGTFKSNTIKPDTFGDEIMREADLFGACIVAPEKNNHGHATIARLKQLDANLYYTQPADARIETGVVSATGISTTIKEYGWHTNASSKPKMLFAFLKAISDDLISLNDKDLVAECRAYTRNDLIENEKDPRLTTRHFDLLIAACIAWQMKDFAEVETQEIEEEQPEDELLYPEIGM